MRSSTSSMKKNKKNEIPTQTSGDSFVMYLFLWSLGQVFGGNQIHVSKAHEAVQTTPNPS